MSLSDELREVYGLHAFAELFGFDWDGDTDWTWHDVACAMADRIDAELADAEGTTKCLQGLADANAAESERLRELAEKTWKVAERLCQAFEGPCKDDGVSIHKPCPLNERDEECVYGQLQRELRELGIEVE